MHYAPWFAGLGQSLRLRAPRAPIMADPNELGLPRLVDYIDYQNRRRLI